LCTDPVKVRAHRAAGGVIIAGVDRVEDADMLSNGLA
jgi:hypothetical protein